MNKRYVYLLIAVGALGVGGWWYLGGENSEDIGNASVLDGMDRLLGGALMSTSTDQGTATSSGQEY